MQKLLGLLILGLACTIGVSTVGCSKKKEETPPAMGGGDGKKLTVKAENLTVNKGDKKDVKIVIAVMDEDVLIAFKAPPGITIEGGKIKKGEKSHTYSVEVDKGAKEGDHEVTVTAKGGGEEKTDTFKVTVPKGEAPPPPAKGKFSVEDATAEIKGGKGEATIKIMREKFEEPVEVTLSDLPKGITPKEKSVTLKKDETDAKFHLEADKTADEKGGEATITAKAGDVEKTGKLKISVKK
jgi:uncharacterized membrane protein